MELGKLIQRLEQADPDLAVRMGFGSPHSYRGYYDELAFEPEPNVSVGDMLEAAKGALGKTFIGYKGGEFTMDEYTTVWISRYGEGEGEIIGLILLGYMLGEYPS